MRGLISRHTAEREAEVMAGVQDGSIRITLELGGDGYYTEIYSEPARGMYSLENAVRNLIAKGDLVISMRAPALTAGSRKLVYHMKARNG